MAGQSLEEKAKKENKSWDPDFFPEEEMYIPTDHLIELTYASRIMRRALLNNLIDQDGDEKMGRLIGEYGEEKVSEMVFKEDCPEKRKFFDYFYNPKPASI